jgi:hypothetical protein
LIVGRGIQPGVHPPPGMLFLDASAVPERRPHNLFAT